MFIQVVHDVLDAPSWTKLATETQGKNAMPTDLKLVTSVTAQDRSHVFCLWEADSVEALSRFLDPFTQGVLKNTYYAVDPGAPLTNLPDALTAH